MNRMSGKKYKSAQLTKFICLVVVLASMIITMSSCTQKPSFISNESLSDEIGREMKIVVYVNNIEIPTPVYENKTGSGYIVLLEPICEALDATFEFVNDSIIIKYNDEEFIIDKVIPGFNITTYWVVDEKVFILFGLLSYTMEGSIKQNDYQSMYLFTKDFVRLDIPATLDECYEVLDNELTGKAKRDIKKSSLDGLIDYHFGLGLWIRNNWIYPVYSAEDRIVRVFLDAGITHPDDMSHEIITGYHYYLNSIVYEIGKSKFE